MQGNTRREIHGGKCISLSCLLHALGPGYISIMYSLKDVLIDHLKIWIALIPRPFCCFIAAQKECATPPHPPNIQVHHWM